MTEHVHGGIRFWLWDSVPDWSIPYRVTIRRPSHVERTVSGEEIRRPVGAQLRVAQSFRCILTGDDARAAEKWLASVSFVDVVAVPFWPGIHSAGAPDHPAFASQVRLAVSPDFTRSEVFDLVVPEWAAPSGYAVPLIFGRLTDRSIEWLNPEAMTVRIAHTESVPKGLLVSRPENGWTRGPQIDFVPTRFLLPIQADWRNPSQSAEQSVERTQISFGMSDESAARSEPHRTFSASLTAHDSTEAARLFRFFLDHSGSAPFWVPGHSGSALLTSDVLAGERSIPAPNHCLAPGEWISFSTGGQQTGFARIESVTESVLSFEKPLPKLTRGETLITRLSLCRFSSDQLTVDFDSPGLATIQTEFRELPPEADSDDDRVPGETVGETAQRVWLYYMRDGDYEERWTSNESNVLSGPLSYEPAQISHGDITSSLNGSRDSVTVTVGVSASRIARALLNHQTSGRVSIQIGRGESVDGESRNIYSLFSGEVEAVSLSGLTIKLTCRPWAALLRARVPAFRVQPGCNHVLYSAGCGISTESQTYTATVSATGPSGWPFEFALASLVKSPGPEPTYTENWFAGGWIEIGFDRVQIRRSTVPSGGAITVTLARDPPIYPGVGDPVTLHPGCDGRWETCREKFENGLNFGGHPHIPTANPSLVKLSPTFAGGKK